MSVKLLAWLIGFLGVCGSWVCYPFLVRYYVERDILGVGITCENTLNNGTHDPNSYTSSKKWERFGQHGDTYGGLTALFAMLSFLGIGMALCVQYKQYKVQRLELLSQHVPMVEWLPPALLVIGISKKDARQGFLGAIVKLIVNVKGTVPCVNFVSRCRIFSETNRLLAECACSNQGSTIYGETSLVGCHYLTIGNDATEFLEALILRKKMVMRVESYYQNHIGGSFYRSKDYVLDAPIEEDRKLFAILKGRIEKGWVASPDDKKAFESAGRSIWELITGKDTFVLPHIAAISQVSMACNSVKNLDEYIRGAAYFDRVINTNRLPFKNAEQSFCLLK